MSPELSEPMPDADIEARLLDLEQKARTLALSAARPLLTAQGLGSRTPPDVNDLIRLAQWILDGKYEDLYPFLNGDVTVLGPGIFSANDRSVICWRGRNYVPEEDDDGHDDD